jgi:hypothetical protein
MIAGLNKPIGSWSPGVLPILFILDCAYKILRMPGLPARTAAHQAFPGFLQLAQVKLEFAAITNRRDIPGFVGKGGSQDPP